VFRIQLVNLKSGSMDAKEAINLSCILLGELSVSSRVNHLMSLCNVGMFVFPPSVIQVTFSFLISKILTRREKRNF